MTLSTLIEDDDFDWEAAVSEIDKACSKSGASASGSGAGAGAESSQPQSTQRLKQKTLDSFIRDAKGRHQFNSGKQHQRVSEFSLRENGNQGRVEACGFRAQQDLPPGKLDRSFFREGKGNQFNDGKHHQKISECSVRETGNQGRVETNGCRVQQEHPFERTEESFRCEVPFDPVAASTWIYPANVPCRTYQFNITKVALFSNTLVSLPTGLGKTLIAAAVMYNYFRWFPTGKIIFAAPSRPLVVQQIEACHKVVGIPQDMTIDMTGDMSPPVRAEYWQSRRVFFVTPQCLEKDIQSGTCTSRQIVCLVIDEAHRATGNYSYCVIVRQLLAAKINYRLLALTATPGSKQITIQAVVDNLQISCLEYRNENDPDVSQYTHNRKIELIEVPMNAESNKVKDLLIEVLQPIVYRLCGFRVFYNREIARLTPFEFIQAREKFRQAPPPSIPQNEYSQVEMYFGLAITLTHIFKLLFTHGMRPAYEMLQQKIQQGVLKRLAGNDKMRHLQSVMKQTVGHGAPSPKLDKVVEIINIHFRAHDPAKTRVIIFTNFRESVKDIMEILAARCTDVKAMEFIGQSSGKASKGQSQKTQQAVLQKFRAGGFNTIVATSIAEEGLDIMEVDLVICFDANISPLRMIQRMGRTGRKRDGRVVVLACEGAEKEGYLAKQNKNKALNKHMVKGGVYSFNFHPSSHMIPHSYRPAVQLVELAIEDFVPRTKKLKVKSNEATVGGLRSLSEEELQLMENYKISSREELWKPSLIAFPQYQLIPTPVHKVKHSHRTSMLIDTLRSLQETAAQVTGITQVSREEKFTIPTEAIPHLLQEPSVDETVMLSSTPEKFDAAHEELEIENRRELLPATSSYGLNCAKDMHVYNLTSITALNEEVKSAPQHATPFTTEENLVPKPVNESKARTEVLFNNNKNKQDWNMEDLGLSPPVKGHRLVEGLSDVHEVMHTKGGVDCNVTEDLDAQEIVETNTDSRTDCYTATPPKSPPLSLDEPLMEDSILSQVTAFGSHRCKYSSGVVFTTDSGLIILAPSPSVPSGKFDGKRFTKFEGHSKENIGKPVSDKRTSLPGFRLGGRVLKNMPTVKSKALGVHGRSEFDNGLGVVTPMSPLAGAVRQNVDMNVVTRSDMSMEGHCVLDRKRKSGGDVEIVSSRLDEIASQGVVPSSPPGKKLSDHGDISTPPLLKNPCVPKPGPNGVQRSSITLLESYTQHQKTPVTPITITSGAFLMKRDAHSQSRRRTSDSKLKKTPVSSFLCRINGLSPAKGKLLNFSEDGPEGTVNVDASDLSRKKPMITSEVHLPLEGQNVLNAEGVTTPQGRSQKCPSEEWQITESKGSSVKRPRKLKRLCKAGEKSNRPSNPKMKQLKKVGAEDLPGGKSSRPDSKAGKNQRKLMVRSFFDEEAEVSDDDESSDQDDSEDDIEGEADGFIDSAGTQHLNGPVDMMAVYRRSLMTQSPADLEAQHAHLLQTSSTTCSDGTPRSSDELSPSNASTIPGPTLGSPVNDSSPIRIDSLGRKPTLHQVSRFNQNSVANAQAGNNSTTPVSSTLIYEDQRKLELRKRKLSFQPNSGNAGLSEPSSHVPQKESDLFYKADFDLVEAREPQAKIPVDLVKETSPIAEFEDDLFDGVDLDALEAEAAQTCRIRGQKVGNFSQEVPRKQDFGVTWGDLKAQSSGITASRPRLFSRLRKDDNFGGCPSFDLGIAD